MYALIYFLNHFIKYSLFPLRNMENSQREDIGEVKFKMIVVL